MKDFDVQREPFVVPVDDGKLIEEHFGLASIASKLSLAHMIAPAGWGEPFQTPEFEEYTYIIKGKKKIEVGDEVVILSTGESIRIKKGVRVRYSNPFEEPCEYLAICSPPFQIEKAHREEE
jgi:mannose-6-phosphate isomerase-like protein (cupin superfamily)